jgi:hypothetical protein
LLICPICSDGALLISTLIPFEGADGEDSTALSVGEMITKVQELRIQLNSERKEEAERAGKDSPELIPQCEHLWVVSGVSWSDGSHENDIDTGLGHNAFGPRETSRCAHT